MAAASLALARPPSSPRAGLPPMRNDAGAPCCMVKNGGTTALAKGPCFRSIHPNSTPMFTPEKTASLRSTAFFGNHLPTCTTTLRASPSATGKSNGTLIQAASYPKSVLIVNTNSGGHAIIGFWLARHLAQGGHEVTILTVGQESSDKMTKPPFSRFSELRSLGVKTIWGNPDDVGDAVGFKVFDVVMDNNGKDLESVKPVIDWARAWRAKQFIFISSAGMYKTNDEPPYVEGDPVKEDAGHCLVENYLKLQFPNKWASFRPQYITGDANNKDCEEWFFDRIVRDRPVPIPSPGVQMTVIAHAADLASMLALAIENPEKANGNVFNAVSDRCVTFDGLVRMCARAVGKEAKIVHYDPKAVGVDAKKAFPFRNQHFYSEPRAAKRLLGWESKVNFQEALNERFRDYLAIGRDKKAINFELDDKILLHASSR